MSTLDVGQDYMQLFECSEMPVKAAIPREKWEEYFRRYHVILADVSRNSTIEMSRSV